MNVYLTRVATTEFFFSFPFLYTLMNVKKILTIVTWTLLAETQMGPLWAPVYLDLKEMDGNAQVKAFIL